MSLRTFFALLSRDAHVARRNLAIVLAQNLLQPLMFVFVFGKVMVSSGFMPERYQALLLPGIIAVCMMISGIQGVALGLLMRTDEIDGGAAQCRQRQQHGQEYQSTACLESNIHRINRPGATARRSS